MTSKPKREKFWYKWTPEVFREDTIHLTHVQRGLYRDLIDYYMETRKPIPDNDIALSNICRIELSTWIVHSVEIRAMFLKIKDEKGIALLQLKRCEENLALLAGKSKKAAEKGKKGGRPKALKKKGNKPTALQQQSRVESREQRVEEERTDSSLFQDSFKTPLTPRTEQGGDFKPSVSGKEALGALVRFDIERLLSDKVRERAKLLARALNRDFFVLCQTYNEGVREGKRPPPDNPDGAFLAWIPAYTKGKKL